MEITEDRTSELQDRSIEFTQSEQQKGNEQGFGSLGITAERANVPIITVAEGEEELNVAERDLEEFRWLKTS